MGWADSASARMPHLATALSDDAALALSDAGSALERDLAETTDAFSAADACAAHFPYQASCSEDVGLLDSSQALFRQFASNVTDAFSAVDACAGLFPHLGSCSEDLGLADDFGGKFAYLASFSDDFSADLADLVVKLLSEIGQLLYSFADDAGAEFSDEVGARLNILALSEDDAAAALADLVAAALIEVGAAFPLEYSFSDDASADLTDSAAALHSFLALASDTLSYSDIVSAINRHLAKADDAVALSDALNGIERMLGISTDNIGITDDIGGLFRYYAEVSDSVQLADQVIRILRFIGAIVICTKYLTSPIAEVVPLHSPITEEISLGDLCR
jgi:hypothetical protein